ncbi:hypothetical protein [Chroococcidiopsis sp.]
MSTTNRYIFIYPRLVEKITTEIREQGAGSRGAGENQLPTTNYQ